MRSFMQAQVNRIVVGELRYGAPNRRKKYLTRSRLELRQYSLTGNIEHLLNAANYCFLETYAPQNPKCFFDPAAASATRDHLGGNIA